MAITGESADICLLGTGRRVGSGRSLNRPFSKSKVSLFRRITVARVLITSSKAPSVAEASHGQRDFYPVWGFMRSQNSAIEYTCGPIAADGSSRSMGSSGSLGMANLVDELVGSAKSTDGDDVEPTEELDDGYLEWPFAEKVGVDGAELSDAVHECSLADVSCAGGPELTSSTDVLLDCRVAINFGSWSCLSSRMIAVVE